MDTSSLVFLWGKLLNSRLLYGTRERLLSVAGLHGEHAEKDNASM